MKLNENTKVTLTIGQLKALVKEDNEPNSVDSIKQKLMDEMKKNNLTEVVLHNPSSAEWEGLGVIKLNGDKLSYDKSRNRRYFTHDEYAYKVALNQLNDNLKMLKKFGKRGKAVVNHFYKGELTNSDTLTGTWDSIFEKVYKRRNSLRYCNNDHIGFEDKKVEELYNTWLDFLPRSRSFDMYYGGGVVDEERVRKPKQLGTHGFVEMMLKQHSNPDDPVELTQEQKDEINYAVGKFSLASQKLLDTLHENGCGDFAEAFFADLCDRYLARF